MELRNPQDSIQGCDVQASITREPEDVMEWIRQAFRGTRLAAAMIVDDLHAEVPPSLFYWTGDRSDRLAPYRDAALGGSTAEFLASLRVGGAVRICLSLEDIDKLVVANVTVDRISLKVPYEMATLFALKMVDYLAPYRMWVTTRED